MPQPLVAWRAPVLWYERLPNNQMTTLLAPQAASGGVTILVIDDSATVRSAAGKVLSEAGYRVVMAENGFDALAKVNDVQPDLIFCDILMPRLDGYQTCAIIKRNEKYSSIPVVMLSSKDGVFDKARGRMVGCQEYLTKPFTKDQLLQAVQQFGNSQQGAM